MKFDVAQQLSVLDFDSECRPMHYSEWRAESQITGIAWSWHGESTVYCTVLEQDLGNEVAMLEEFLTAYNQADIVTGHYIRKHDLPLLNEHSVRAGFGPIKPKLTIDTQADMTSIKGLGKSQENLAVWLNLAADKHHMTGSQWRIANALTAEGQAGTRKRVIDDVLQHKALRAALLERGLLKTPRLWRP